MPPDYSGQNLRGRSFKGQNLEGANFSKADIRGADFTNANLKGADFTRAKAGLQRHWVIGLLIASWLLSTISGFFSLLIGLGLTFILDPSNTQNFIAAIASLIFLIIFCILTFREGLTAGLGSGALSGLGSVGGTVVIAIAVAGVGVFGVAFVVAAATAIAVAYARSVAGSVAFAIAVAVTIALPGAVTVALLGYVPKAFAVSVVFTLFSAYIGWRSLEENEKDAWVRSFAITFAKTGGTNFFHADLTDADFTGAILKNTNFQQANLTRTRFYETKKLYLARLGDSILAKRNILNLLVSCNGRNQSYVGANLRGANLIDADLEKANLKDADISEATFQGAILEGANLTLAQAVGTNFTNAKMTGACVEAWNIESTTKLDNVDCRVVYLLEYPKPGTYDDRERRPSSGEFQPGEFTKLFEEVLNTVDLIFQNGIDWKAFVNAFKKVQVENGDTELAIQSIENKGDGVVVIKVAVPDNADKEKIHSDFTQNYQLALAAVEEKYKTLLQAKDELLEEKNKRIEDNKQQYSTLRNITELLADKQISVENKIIQEIKQMNNSNDSSRKITFGNVGRDFIPSGQALSLGDISGTLTTTINELPSAPEPDKPGIKELLTQLQTAIEADENLSKEDKDDALEEVNTLAKLAQNPQDEEMPKKANKAVRMLNRVFQNIPTAVSLLDLVTKISGFLGLG
ncbi:pentapeptide repeat-containing protein [Sphaerospermopsis aphanizomenoides BCCUSP55]|uniref:pentapeptide repeat-containing protein n=1 Tax=Sphaerospermopsis aphanizomenoides TaxID=459663 RepID=UPI001905F263|nr:pentapeptide repeat-containing protein [Sphaerospermopsis aphanizomenoides]MBK1989309.1 pentapeptide repeat-containing protein [Sphaerospermopsis aphanizomenoides BCCUSP55]